MRWLVIALALLFACGGSSSDPWAADVTEQRVSDCREGDDSDTIEGECRCLIRHLREDRGNEEALELTADIGPGQWFELFEPYLLQCAGATR